MPAYQLLMRTHQQVLLKLHMQSGKAPETAKDYHAAMADFDTTNLSANQRPHTPTCIQTMLLMAHNGLLELSAKGCKLLLEAVDEYSKDWLRQTLGTHCLTKLRLISLETGSWHLQKMLSPFLRCLPLPLSSNS